MPDEKFDDLLSVNNGDERQPSDKDNETVKFTSPVDEKDINKYADVDEVLEDVVLGEAGSFEVDIDQQPDDEIVSIDDSDSKDTETQSETEASTETKDPEKSVENDVPAEDLPEETEETGIHIQLTIKGTKTWNTREPYIITLDEVLLQKDYDVLDATFYLTEESSENKDESKEIKASLMKYLRAPHSNARNEYHALIFKIISSEADKIKEYFDFKDKSALFIYHLGPLSVYQIMSAVLKISGAGYCYRHVSGTKIKKEFPEELLKETVLQWFEENINVLDLDFDSVYKFNEVKNKVSKRYQSVVKVFNKRHYDLNLKVGPGKSISREELIRLKGDTWFGTGNMIVYKRFITKTIFN